MRENRMLRLRWRGLEMGSLDYRKPSTLPALRDLSTICDGPVMVANKSGPRFGSSPRAVF
jgi:hypothetical protein